LYVQSGGRIAGPFYGDVTLSAGDRISLAVHSANSMLNCIDDPPSDGGTEVIISSDYDVNDPSLKTINAVAPDANGNITLIGRSCLNITADSANSTLILDDTCAKPCCTCQELEPIKEKMESLGQSIASLDSHTNTLALQVEFLSQSSGSIK